MKLEARKIRLIMELRQHGITDTAVLSAIERVPRELFVLPQFQDQAYENSALPIEEGQTISQPYVVAFMTQILQINKNSKILEIGTGSGYQTAVLSKLCRRVFTIERYRSLLKRAENRLILSRVNNVVTRYGDGFLGWHEQAPFDRIIVTAAATIIPSKLKDQLADDGIMVIPVESSKFNQDVVKVVKSGSDFTEESLLPVRFVPLVRGIADNENEHAK